jgi:formylglycine-generating enzyme required for sulfatase activity
MNRKTLLIGISATLCIVVLFFACDLGVQEPGRGTGGAIDKKVIIPISIKKGMGRTLLPEISLDGVGSYELLGTFSAVAETQLAEFTTMTNASVALNTGTWNFTLKVYKEEALFLEGSITDKLISSSADSLDFLVAPPMGGQGSISITITVPNNAGIVSAAVFKDDSEVSASPVAVTDNTLVYTESPIDSGNYFISFHFKDSNGTIIVIVSELVFVRADLLTTANIELETTDLDFVAMSPSGLTAAPQSDGSIKLEWNVVAGADEYTIYRSDVSDGTYEPIDTSSASPYTDTRVTSSTTYYYKVSAVNNNHAESARSDYAVAVTFHAAPITINPGEDWDLLSQAQSVVKGSLTPFSVPEPYTVRQWYLDSQPQGDDSTYTFDAREKDAGDAYEMVVVVIDSSGAQRSSTCRITIIGIPEGFVYIPGATVTGSGSSGVFVEGRTVEISPFAMAKYETTYELWYEVRVWAAEHGYTFANQGMEGYPGTTGAAPTTAKNEPVTHVSWWDVMVWCNAYSEKENRYPVYTYSGAVIKDATNTTACDNAVMDKTKSGFRLPTEVEWEFAARGGNPGDTTNWGYTYAGSNTVGDVAWYTSNSGSNSHPVGTKAANSASLYDMSGNVWEWCWDWYGSVSSSTPADGATSGRYRVIRGGGWNDVVRYAGVSYRHNGTPSSMDGHSCFRVVSSPSS